jgi:hypothetical protein
MAVHSGAWLHMDESDCSTWLYKGGQLYNNYYEQRVMIVPMCIPQREYCWGP